MEVSWEAGLRREQGFLRGSFFCLFWWFVYAHYGCLRRWVALSPGVVHCRVRLAMWMYSFPRGVFWPLCVLGALGWSFLSYSEFLSSIKKMRLADSSPFPETWKYSASVPNSHICQLLYLIPMLARIPQFFHCWLLCILQYVRRWTSIMSMIASIVLSQINILFPLSCTWCLWSPCLSFFAVRSHGSL